METDIRAIGEYEITGELGRGSFGTIYSARSPQGETVMIQRCGVEDDTVRRRFEREARDAARLEHPNVLRVLDVGSDGETPFVVQELVEGERVDEALKGRHGWSPLQKLGLLTQVAEGLAYAHDAGVLHRDLEPRNLLLGRDGTVRIADFGIARLASDESQVTQKGVTYAAAAYMPPEQVRGGDVDHRADIFSFGVLAYELLASRRPFRGKTVSALVYQILYKAAPPLVSAWPEAPSELSEIVGRCLEKEPGDRYPDVHALRTDLDALVRAIGAGEHPALRREPSGVTNLDGTLPGREDDVVSRSLIARTAAEVEKRRSGAAALDATIQEGEVLVPPPLAGTAPDATAGTTPPESSTMETQRISVMPPGGSPTLLDPTGPTSLDQTGELAQEISQLVAQGNLQQALEQLESSMGASAHHPAVGDAEMPTVKLRAGEPPPPIGLPGSPPPSPAPPPSSASPSAEPTAKLPTIDPPPTGPDLETGPVEADASASYQLAPTPPPMPLPPLEQPPLEQPPLEQPPVDLTFEPPPSLEGATIAHVPAAGSTAQAPSVAPAPSEPADGDRGLIDRIGGPKVALLAAAAIGGVLLLLALFTLLGGDDEEAAPPPVVEARPVPPPPAPIAPAAPRSALLIDARPWAEIREVTDAEGFVIDLPVNAATPLFLPVEPGVYRVSLMHPDAGEPQLCEGVEVSEEGVGQCVATFVDDASSRDYFKDSGWWR